jgi:molybdopterin/thiamine biosynthesis adenylyltransferase
VRSEALWGSEGQKILGAGRVALVGLGPLGIEVSKALVTLGIGHIVLIDQARNHRGELFLDQPCHPGSSRTESLQAHLRWCFGKRTRITALHACPSKTMVRLFPVDVIIDCTNDPACHQSSLEVAQDSEIALFTACADERRGEIGFFCTQIPSRCDPVTEGYVATNQGSLISSVLCGVLVEEVRKVLFKKNRDRFTRPILRESLDADPEAWFESHDYRDTVDQERLLGTNFYHDIGGLSIPERVGQIRSLAPAGAFELFLDHPSIAVFGCGALGNFAALLLAYLPNGSVDFIDIDHFADHNVQRQHLAYDGVGQLKADVLAKKTRAINPRLETHGIVGFVGDRLENSVLADHQLRPSAVTLVDSGWIHNRGYNLILGCFDNMKARRSAARFAYDLRIPYIDAGSGAEPTRGSIRVYDPARDDTSIEDEFALEERSQEEQNRRWTEYRSRFVSQQSAANEAEVFIQGQSCGEFVAGSVSMGNQVAASLMVAEARRILSPRRFPGEIVRSADYRADLSFRLTAA